MSKLLSQWNTLPDIKLYPGAKWNKSANIISSLLKIHIANLEKY